MVEFTPDNYTQLFHTLINTGYRFMTFGEHLMSSFRSILLRSSDEIGTNVISEMGHEIGYYYEELSIHSRPGCKILSITSH